MIEIPHQRLEPSTLRALVEDFVTRDGTDYGLYECPLETKVHQVMAQLKSGEVIIVFDEQQQSCQLVLKR